MFLGMIFWLLIIIGIVLLIIWLVRTATGVQPEKKLEEDPLEILKMRLAKGEIDEETYNRLSKKLK